MQKVDLEQINNQSLDIYIVPARRRQLDQSFELKQVNLTWDAIKFEQNEEKYELEIKIDFLHPYEISPDIV